MNLPSYMQSIHNLVSVDEIGIEQSINPIHATDLNCSGISSISFIVKNIVFDILAFIPQSISISSFLDQLRHHLLNHSPPFDPISHFLIQPYLPIALSHSLPQQPFYPLLPLPSHWQDPDSDLAWRLNMQVGVKLK